MSSYEPPTDASGGGSVAPGARRPSLRQSQYRRQAELLPREDPEGDSQGDRRSTFASGLDADAAGGDDDVDATKPRTSRWSVVETTKTEATWGSLNYDHFINDASIEANKRWRPRQKQVCFGYSGKTLTRWVLTCVIGVSMGATAITIARLVEILLGARTRVMPAAHEAPWYVTMAVYTGWNCMLAFVAAVLVVVVAPGASGSGIPVVKAYLNGVRPAAQTCLSLRVFVVKLVSTVLAVASNASLGQEGPLVHLGAIIGSLVTGGLASESWRWVQSVRRFAQRSLASVGLVKPAAALDAAARRQSDAAWEGVRRGDAPPFFRSDVDRRDFLSIGAACGFSAAFGAPIGGVLFALEEASSFFTNELLLRCLVGTALATFTALVLSKNIVGLQSLSHYGLISLNSDDTTVMVGVLPVAVAFGLVGGLVGALFNHCWVRLQRWRQRRLRTLEERGVPCYARQLVRVLDATACVFLTSVLFYGTALASRSWACVPRDIGPHIGGGRWTVRFNCDHGQIHELASLWFHGNTRERAITKILDAKTDEFSAASLFVSGILTLTSLVLTFGHALSGGMFLPLIFAGVSLGGAVTRCDWLIGFIAKGAREHLGLLGAVALLAGVQRSTVSLVVIILEGTGNASLLIPIIIATVCARWVGDLFGPGLYELSLELKETPFLDKHVHKHMDDLQVRELVRGQTLVVLPPTPMTTEATAVLRRSLHGAFPVVRFDEHRRTTHLLGLVLREHVRALLHHRHFVDHLESSSGLRGKNHQSPPTPNAPTQPPLGLQRLVAMAAWDAGRSRDRSHDATTNAAPSSPVEHDGGHFLSDPLLLSPPPSPPRRRSDDESKLPMALDDDDDGDNPLAVGDVERADRIDLEYVMVRSPHVVYDDCPVSRAYRLFVTMGLRHLIIVDHTGAPIGIVTRRDWLNLLGHDH